MNKATWVKQETGKNRKDLKTFENILSFLWTLCLKCGIIFSIICAGRSIVCLFQDNSLPWQVDVVHKREEQMHDRK